MPKSSVTTYILEEVDLLQTYDYYGRHIHEYRLTLDTGERVLFNRAKDAEWQPYVGQEIIGEIVEGKRGATLKLKALPKAKKVVDDEPKINIMGTQLYLAYLDQKKLDSKLTIDAFINDFRKFQQHLL
jgi:hypothetical protein